MPDEDGVRGWTVRCGSGIGRARERIERWWVVSARGGGKFWTEREGALLEARRERYGRLMVKLGVKA